MGLSKDEVIKRGYVYKDNPAIKLYNDIDLTLNLAINTNQNGRVFQDRSHVFSIRERPNDLDPNTKIHNLNVRGRN
jgi:hypothetical protein